MVFFAKNIDYFTIICLFENFSDIKGFTLYEVLLCFGVIQFGYAFCESFARGMDNFDKIINKLSSFIDEFKGVEDKKITLIKYGAYYQLYLVLAVVLLILQIFF